MRQEETVIRPATVTDIDTIISLAHQIWPVTYGTILQPGQLTYMLNLFYNRTALQEQMEQQHQFLLVSIQGRPAGFAGYSATAQPGTYKLHKLYVHSSTQGMGIGKKLVDYIIEQLQQQQAQVLQLNVNRHNKALGFYQKLGFGLVKEEDIAIGNGYFMNDYVLEKQL